MNPTRKDVSRGTGRAGLIILGALALLIALSVTVWASWGAAWRDGLGAALEARLTATPTRTPRPVTPTSTSDLAVPLILTFTPTPVPAATPTATALPVEDEADKMSPYLADIVAKYGMDPARRFVVIDPNIQRMTVWDPTQATRELLISTGDEDQGYFTLPWYGLVGEYWGTFHAFGVYADDGWYLFDDPTGSILIHSAPYKLVDGQKVYEDLDALGNYPASHGCIRLAPEDARWFTAWQPQGVPLVVLPKRSSTS